MSTAAIDLDSEHQYVTGQFRPTFPALLADFAARSAAAVATAGCELDLRYGAAERQTFDFFAARGSCRGTLLYFHAGYWQSRDKADFRFIAPAFNDSGLNVALVNYPLCPEVSLAELVQACRAAPAAVAAACRGGRPRDRSADRGRPFGGRPHRGRAGAGRCRRDHRRSARSRR